MKLLDRYIATHVIWGTLLALMVLVALFTFIAFVEDLESVGQGEYSMWRALEFMVLTLPRRSFELFPIAALIGSLLGLGILAGNSELTVMQSSGVSSYRVSWAVMKAGLVLMTLALLIGEVLAPLSERFAQERRSVALTKRIALGSSQGFWIRDGRSFINIRQVFPDNHMGQLHIYEFDDDKRLRIASFADSAQYSDGVWVLENIRQSFISEDKIDVRRIKRAVWDSLFEPDLVNVVAVKPESLSALGLYRYLGYLRENGLDTDRYELALWGKLPMPVATGVMIFLSIPLVLGRLRDSGVGSRILVGVLLGMVFHVIQQTTLHVGIVFGVSALMSVLAPIAIFLGLASILMSRVR